MTAGFDVHVTPYGRAATELLASEIVRLKGDDRLAPVTVIVPSNYAAVSVRRSLAARPGGVANVSFLTLSRVAERLGGRALAVVGRRPVSAPVIGQAVRSLLLSAPGVFAPVADHPATELALAAAVRELSPLEPEALDAVAALSARSADVVRLVRAVRDCLAAGWYDQDDLIRSATAAIDQFDPGSPVIVHLLQELTPAGAGLLQVLAGQRLVVVNVGACGDASADRHVIEAHVRAGITVAPAGVARPVAARVISVSDPDEEVRAAIRAVAGWMSNGVRLGRMAVLYASRDPYARLLHEQLSAAGLAHNGAPVRSVGDMLLGRTLRALLALPDREFRRSDVLSVVTGSGLFDGTDRAPGRAWERLSRRAGVVSGADWDQRLGLFASEQRLLADEADRTEQPGRGEQLRRDAERAEQLSAFVARLKIDLQAVTSATSWAEMAAAAGRVLDGYVGRDRRRWGWDDEERRAAERVEETLERLAALDSVAGPAPTVEVFRRALDGELEQTLGRSGRLGDGVLTGPVSMAVGLELDRVIILGMAEGSFPASPAEDPLLPDDERRAAGGQLRLRSDRISDDHRFLLAAVAAATEAVLVFPRGDLRRHGDRVASRWLLDDAAVLAGREAVFTEDLAGLDGGWLEKVPSYAAGLQRTSFPSTAQDLRLAHMLHAVQPIVDGDAVLGRGMELAAARRGGTFTRFDGNLAGSELPDYTAAGRYTSATALQTWAKCPHAYLLRYLLGVEPVEDPERLLEMSPLEKGSLVHEILDRFISEQITAGRCGPWTGDEARRLRDLAEETCRRYEARGLTGRGLFWRRDRGRITADLEQFAAKDTGWPMHTELRFRDSRFPLPDGRTAGFSGSIDRVDRLDGDAVEVIDYKTGKADAYRQLSPGNPDDRGLHLQLAVYAEAARQLLDAGQVEAWYWFVTDKGRYARAGYQVTDEVRDRVAAAIATIVDGIRAGLFPLRPPAQPAFGWVDCWYCSPDGLSTAEARRDWERKRLHPDLSAYVGLAEPEALDAPA